MISLRQELEQGLEAARRAKPARECGARPAGSHPELIRILENAGYQLSRNRRRAVCPKCSTGRTNFVVAVSLDKGLYNCHRCARGGKIQKLAAAFSFSQPKPRIRRADVPKRQFQQWLDSRMKELADRERRMAWKADLSSQALKINVGWPINQMSWLALADWYHERRRFEVFWQQATDKCGRFTLYRQWRRGSRV